MSGLAIQMDQSWEALDPDPRDERFPDAYALTLRGVAQDAEREGRHADARFYRGASILVVDRKSLAVTLRASMRTSPVAAAAICDLADLRARGDVCEGRDHVAPGATWQCAQCGKVLCEACEPSSGTCSGCFDIVF